MHVSKMSTEKGTDKKETEQKRGTEKGDILLFRRLSRAAAGVEGGLQAQAAGGSVLPARRAERRAAHNAVPHGHQFGFGLRAVDPFLPITAAGDWAGVQRGMFLAA